MADSGASSGDDASSVDRCGDGMKNGLETGTDCGGPDCGVCEDDQGCIEDTDCASGNCGSGFICSTPGCDDAAQNADETDIDCGGGTCPKCANAKKCTENDDCTSGLCNASMRCACMPQPAAMVCGAMECGMKSDGCTGMVTCPFTCPSGQQCQSNACVTMCVANQCPGCPILQQPCCSNNQCGCSFFGLGCN